MLTAGCVWCLGPTALRRWCRWSNRGRSSDRHPEIAAELPHLKSQIDVGYTGSAAVLVKPAVGTPAPGPPSIHPSSGSLEASKPRAMVRPTLHPSPTREGGGAAAHSSAFPCAADSKQQGGSPRPEKAESPAWHVGCSMKASTRPRRNNGMTPQATPLPGVDLAGTELCDGPDLRPGRRVEPDNRRAAPLQGLSRRHGNSQSVRLGCFFILSMLASPRRSSWLRPGTERRPPPGLSFAFSLEVCM